MLTTHMLHVSFSARTCSFDKRYKAPQVSAQVTTVFQIRIQVSRLKNEALPDVCRMCLFHDCYSRLVLTPYMHFLHKPLIYV